MLAKRSLSPKLRKSPDNYQDDTREPACLGHLRPPPHRYCQATPTVLKSVPVRTATPVLAYSLSECRRLVGSPTVSPTRQLLSPSSFLTPLTVVCPPA